MWEKNKKKKTKSKTNKKNHSTPEKSYSDINRIERVLSIQLPQCERVRWWVVGNGLFENVLMCAFNTNNATAFFFLPFPLFLFSPVSLGTTVWMGYSLEVFVNPANAMGMQLSVIFMVFAL